MAENIQSFSLWTKSQMHNAGAVATPFLGLGAIHPLWWEDSQCTTAKFPYLLPLRHPFTILTVHATHAKLRHCGVNITITALRQTYWIAAVRQCVKGLLRHCRTCRRHIGKSYDPPDPASLPKCRTQDVHPFNIYW